MAEDDGKWLKIARQAYDKSTSFVSNNYRKQWEDSLKHFQNKHASGSKYNKASYKYRSKVFRPKTRSAIRNNEAAAAAAFFANQDVVTIESQNMNDPFQKASAQIMQEILNYRLQKTIPWFLLCIGGFQDAQVIGVVCSHQYWDYQTVMGPMGEVVKKDEPCIELMPVENLRIHPNADWTDPVTSSPYLIQLVPMYVMDVKRRMARADDKTGKPKWNNLDDGQIQSAAKHRFDSTRQVREGGREDKTDTINTKALKDFDIVWVHKNFIAVNGLDFVYYTMGTEHMLTQPKPIHEEYYHGQRPFVIGTAIIETHKIFPSGIPELGRSVQQELNEVANQRLDNVKLVLNKRWFVRRGSQTDIKSITRNAPGSVTMVGDLVNDVRGEEFNDVTGSSYQEQDRLNLDFDELIGAFSSSTISSNRKMNETVGGMAMLRGSTNQLVEYLIRTFSETWVEPVMRQLVKLEQAYETDTVVLALAAEKAQLWQKYGVNQITDELLNQELTTTVNVGTGATDPMLKLERLLFAMGTLAKIAANPLPGLKMEEVQKEIFGRLGYKDGSRFIEVQDEQGGQQLAQLQAIIAELQQKLEEAGKGDEVKLLMTEMKEEGQDRRKIADLDAQLTMKRMDLANPVAGEGARGR